MVLMQTVPGMVLEAVMETINRRSKRRMGVETVWEEIETGRVLEERRNSVHKWWAMRGGLCRLG